jgi:CRP/FNR family transcriptional regulator
MRQGEVSDAMFVILVGSVRVARAHPDLREPFVLATLGPGEVVGEMNALDGSQRSVTVTAVDDTVAVALDARTVARMILEQPDLYGGLVRVMSKRLRSTDELAAEMRAKENEMSAPRGG